MDRFEKRRAISMINEGMCLAQEFIERAQNKRQLRMGEALFHAFECLELLYKEAGIEPEGRY